MLVKVITARLRQDAYFYEVELDQALPEEERRVVPFQFGLDIALPTQQAQMVAILTNDYAEHPEEILPFEGEEFDI